MKHQSLAKEDLTSAERVFLQRHGLTPDDLIDARELPKVEWRALAKSEGKNFILGAGCRKAGHRLRTRSGHCIQCDSSKIAYQRRHSKSGFVYIAGSLQARLIKIGGTRSLKGRQESLRRQVYAGASDWRILRRQRAPEYGRLEQRVRSVLARFALEVEYVKEGGEMQVAQEVFACGASAASGALDLAISELSLTPDSDGVASCIRHYEFER